MANAKTLDKRMEEIEQQQKHLQLISIICIAIVVAVIILFMFRNRAVVIVTLCVFILFYLFWYRKQAGKYSDSIIAEGLIANISLSDPPACAKDICSPNEIAFADTIPDAT